MSIFAEKVIPITVRAWTLDLSTFEVGEDSCPQVPADVREDFDRLGYDVRVQAGKKGVLKVVISFQDADDPWYAPTQTLHDGDTLIITKNNKMSILGEDG